MPCITQSSDKISLVYGDDWLSRTPFSAKTNQTKFNVKVNPIAIYDSFDEDSFDGGLRLSKLMMEPTAGFVDRGEGYSNCFRLRTSHQSTANIAKATNLILAHSPTYLQRM